MCSGLERSLHKYISPADSSLEELVTFLKNPVEGKPIHPFGKVKMEPASRKRPPEVSLTNSKGTIFTALQTLNDRQHGKTI